MASIIDTVKAIRNYYFPITQPTPNSTWRGGEQENKKNLRSYISPVQLQRLAHDVKMWREAIQEAEQAWYPQRVRMQRMFIDTILSGHTLACVQRRKDLTLLREFQFVDEQGNENEDLHKLFDKKWFWTLIEWALDAQFYGYSLIALGDMVDYEFPAIDLIRRFNVSPDRLNVTSYVCSLSGAQFLDEPYKDWHLWVPTPTSNGISKVGYGVLYSVALYEIMCRNLLGNNADAAELYGMPTRVGRTSKQDDERSEFAAMLQQMGSSGWILLDEIGDTVELVEASGTGQGFKIYPDLEQRLEKKISKLVLGHADALDSTPGKLGGSSGEDNPVAESLRGVQAKDGTFIQNVINDDLLPKLKALGFNIPDGFKFQFSNNHEKHEQREREDGANKLTADIAMTMSQAGLKMDAKYFTERTGIPVTEVAPSVPALSNKVKMKLENLYK